MLGLPMRHEEMTDTRTARLGNSTQPRVSVLVPAHNAARHLRAAIDSVLAQTFTEFELIVIDDGSNDDTQAILASYLDGRIRLHRFEQNVGVSQARNAGLEIANGEYVALLDADDIAYATRLEKQINYLDKHPDIVAVGTLVDFIDDDGKKLYSSSMDKPCSPEDVGRALMWGCCLVNSSVTMRRDCVLKIGGYNGSDVAEDYDLWLRLSDAHKLANMPEHLCAYRIHNCQASFKKIKKMRLIADMTKMQAHHRKIALGYISPQTQPPLPSLLDKLRGQSFTLASDYLNWAVMTREFKQYKSSAYLTALAIAHGPLCLDCYVQFGRLLWDVAFPMKFRNILLWYIRKASAMLGKGRR
jgi:GT2 family glycosyltransferase